MENNITYRLEITFAAKDPETFSAKLAHALHDPELGIELIQVRGRKISDIEILAEMLSNEKGRNIIKEVLGDLDDPSGDSPYPNPDPYGENE